MNAAASQSLAKPMRIIQTLFLVALAAAAASPRAAALETLRPEQLKSGMKGYGLSVFKGTQPERFEIEVLGVLKNAFPKQDMILIRLSGANLEKHKVIAGMSGSPIYVNGRLIGALAYGWGFENEPLAGVTPIHNMLAELDRKPERRNGLGAATQTENNSAHGTEACPPGRAAPTFAGSANPRPLLTPLSLGGFSPRLIAAIGDELTRFGLMPTAAGGGSGEPQRASARLEPGSAIGVQLIRGDLNAVAIGTVTWVGNNKVLAFGHPFFHAGPIEAPAVLGEVHTIMSSVERSFKLATSAGDAGALVGDWQSCIVADTQRRAPMIPVTVTVNNPDSGHHERYTLEVIRNDRFTPLFVRAAITQAIASTAGSSQDTTVQVALTAELANRALRVTDTFYHPTGGLLSGKALAPLTDLFAAPFGHPVVRRIDAQINAVLQRRTAEIKRAYFDQAEVERGHTARLAVVLKPFGGAEVTRIIPIQVPAATDTLRQVAVTLLAGDNAPPDIAPPDNQADYLEALEKQHRTTDLVAIVQTPGQGLRYRGKLLKRLPPSILAVLDDDSRRDVVGTADVQQIVVPTDWVLSGQAAARVPIRQE